MVCCVFRQTFRPDPLICFHIGVFFRSKICIQIFQKISLGAPPAEDYGERIILIVQSPDAPLKTHPYIPSPAFCVIEGLTVGEGSAFGVGDEDTLNSGHRFGE